MTPPARLGRPSRRRGPDLDRTASQRNDPQATTTPQCLPPRVPRPRCGRGLPPASEGRAHPRGGDEDIPTRPSTPQLPATTAAPLRRVGTVPPSVPRPRSVG